MADLDMEFIPEDVPEDDRNFEPIPAGDYHMQVIESEIVPTKSGTGNQLVLTLEVIDGPHQNRRIWDRLNIRNANADAQRIAQRSLADLCQAIGLSALKNTEQLHFRPFTGRVTIKQDKSGEYGPQNRVRYKARGGNAPRPTSAAPAQNAASQSTNTAQQRQSANPAQTASRSSGQSRPWVNRPAS